MQGVAITEAQVKEIVLKHLTGWGLEEISKDTGLTTTAVKGVIVGYENGVYDKDGRDKTKKGVVRDGVVTVKHSPVGIKNMNPEYR